MHRPSTALLVAIAVGMMLGCSEESKPEARANGTPAKPAIAKTSAATAESAGNVAALVKKADAAMAQGDAWLLKEAKPDGTFGGPAEVGKAGLVLSALLASPEAGTLRDDPAVKKAIACIVSAQQPDGSIGAPGEKGLANYQTSAAIGALAAYNDPAHKDIIEKAKKFLLSIQNLGSPDDPNFGSWGYSSDKRGDVSNTQFALNALKAAGLDENSKEFKDCQKFLERCQNRSESNDQPWASNDGGGIYYPGASKAGVVKLPDGKVVYKSYGSMTYALLRCFSLVGLKPDDPRVQAAQKWLAENYTLDVNPGMSEDQKHQGLYYYYMSMAKAMALLETPVLEADGKKHYWARDLTERLVSLQDKDGSWVNNAMRWMENDKVLATSYAMMALSECRAALAGK